MQYPRLEKPFIVNGEEFWRAELGVEGNRAYALLGPEFEQGEVEFFEIQPKSEKNPNPVNLAMGTALKQLRDRLKVDLDFQIEPDPRSKAYRRLLWKFGMNNVAN